MDKRDQSKKDEIILRQLEVIRSMTEHNLSRMGADAQVDGCTAIINGAGLCFANAVRRGPIGIVGASGTGSQELSVRIHEFGGGVSQLIGTGGRDLSEKIGGLMMLDAIAMLDADDATQVITLISKPPAPSVAEKVLARARTCRKPVVVCFLGRHQPPADEGNLQFARGTKEAALKAVLLTGVKKESLDLHPLNWPLIDEVRARLTPQQKYIRGLFCGGTLCDEAMFAALEKFDDVYSNIQPDPAKRLDDINVSKAHTFLDFGDDDFTHGNPHPMIDPTNRISRLLQEARDPQVGVIVMDFVLGSIFFFIIGFALMFGGSNAFIGTAGFFHPKSLADADGMFNGLPIGVFMIFQTVFCATSATIVSGAMAERTKFISYLIYSAAISVFIYPITGHWIWGGGWLSQIGFHDFAGSTAVHMVGGLCALAGAKMVGPRIGKYTKEGKPVAIPGHNLPLGALGVFILWFCWFGFNCGSTTAATYNLGDIAMTTNLAAAAATLVTLIVTWVRYGKPDISMTMNGALAGLVAITASCDVVNDYEALFIGAVAGVVVVFAVEFFDKVVKIDDPVGAISVHGVCGALGTLFTGIFGEGCSFITQLIGFVAVAAYTLILAFILFFVLKKTIGLRVTEKEEIDGLDMHEHGCSAYANFHFHNDK